MATAEQYGNIVTRTVKIDTDLSDKEYYAVNLDTSEDNPPVVNIAADASAFPFILSEGVDGSSTAGIGTIILSGRAKVKLGGTIAPGDKLTSDGNGKWITTVTDTDHYGAIAITDGVANDIVEVLVCLGTVSA